MMKIPSKVHFIGICGIGMSGIAQMLKWLGCDVTGSDRAVNSEENSVFTVPFRNLGIRLYHQDGSFLKSETAPDYIVYSTAIENDNPDLAVSCDIPRIHRATALGAAIRHLKCMISIAVTGSAGKTSVTGWISEVLAELGEDPVSITGGIVSSFKSANSAGNFRPGKGRFLVFEADESDKSLLSYSPDYSVILNIGTDHYSIEELLQVFGDFISRTASGAVIEFEALDKLGMDRIEGKKLAIFGEKKDIPPDFGLCGCIVKDYSSAGGVSRTVLEMLPAGTKHEIVLPVHGFHSALNASAVVSLCSMLGIGTGELMNKVPSFKGVWRRFDFAGENSKGVQIYDDYAHNIEKIISCMKTAAGLARGKVIAVFQPHGFGPLGFMRESLLLSLEKNLRDNDIFAFLPVFYAGGSSSFSPTSEETVKLFTGKGAKNYIYFCSREVAEEKLIDLSGAGDIILIMGARDNSLSLWARKIIS